MFALRTARQQSRFLASPRAPALVFISKRFSSSDYGSGEHNNLKRSKSELEHPGPPPPSTGSKDGAASKAESASQKKDDGGKPQPKILDASPPKEGEEPEDVRKHNQEMKERADRPIEGRKD